MADQLNKKTLLISLAGVYELNTMSFGFYNAPTSFEMIRYSVIRGVRWNICLCYLDDIVFYSANFSENIGRLYVVPSCLSSASFRLNHKECHFSYKEMKAVGHLASVSPQDVSQNPNKIKAVKNFFTAESLKSLRSFVGRWVCGRIFLF